MNLQLFVLLQEKKFSETIKSIQNLNIRLVDFVQQI